MSVDQRPLMLLHAVVRGMLLTGGLEQGYGLIFRSILPFVSNCGQKPAMTVRDLQRLAARLYRGDKEMAFTSSCLSISVLIQMLSFWCGIPAELRIGLRKEDGKLLGHAWVVCEMDGRQVTISTGATEPAAYRVTRTFEPTHRSWKWTTN